MIINSILDSDFYKFSMGQVVLFFFKGLPVKYKFILRNPIEFPDGFGSRLQDEINHLATLKLTNDEYKWLATNPNIYRYYLDWLSTYQFNPEEVEVIFTDNKLELTIEGPWERTIYWEVPLLAIISELYFSMTNQTVDSRAVLDRTLEKGKQLAGIPFVDFGTRRRLSFNAHDHVINGFINSESKGNFIGTSNPYFARKYGIWIIGTYAHEAIMAMQALVGVEDCNSAWLEYWKVVYGKMLNVALGDTLTTDYFLNSTNDVMFNLLDGIRQDSGDPIEIGWKIVNKWRELGIDPKTKNIVFSDNLNPDKVKVIWDTFKDITMPIFGVGTNLTNDFGPKPLNMVIKMIEADGKPVVKLSDDKGKYTGDLETIEKVKKELKI
jgi:nicotinate phosphoribosyltransferase